MHTDFSSKLTWEFLRPKLPLIPWTRSVWFKGCIPAHAFTFWVANLDRLPVRQRLVSWGLNVPDTCILCNQATETRDHLFLECDYSKHIWTLVFSKLGSTHSGLRSWSELVDWLQKAGGTRLYTIKHITVQAVIYLLWRERNSRLHAGSPQPHFAVFKQLDRCIKDIALGRSDRKCFRTMLSIWFRHD